MTTYRAKRHIEVRTKQKSNDDVVHHPKEKIEQIVKVLQGKRDLHILELFSGHGNLTKVYSDYGQVQTNDIKDTKIDSYLLYHKLISEKKTYDVIDLDPYGFPNRFFPDIFLLIDNGVMFITMPKPAVNILNGITREHLLCYYGVVKPNLHQIVNKIKTYGLCHWRKLDLISSMDLKSVWRLAFQVEKVKATEYCNVRNRPDTNKNSLLSYT